MYIALCNASELCVFPLRLLVLHGDFGIVPVLEEAPELPHLYLEVPALCATRELHLLHLLLGGDFLRQLLWLLLLLLRG